jgi:subtilisin-like proprotein convertase family protein
MHMRRIKLPTLRRARRLGFDPLEERVLLAVTGLDTSAVDPLGKFSFDLSALHLEHRRFLDVNPNFDAAFAPRNPALSVLANSVSVYTVATGDAAALATGLQSLGLVNARSLGSVVTGFLPIQSLDEMARLPGLKFARPSYMAKTNAGLTTSQADVVANVDIARSQFGVDGTGITIGVLSDSFNALGGAITDSATGDLPPIGQINVLEDFLFEGFFGPFGTDEGRGMMQLIHDLAPGADLAFHTASISELDFALGIEELATEAGAQVIVDDVIYFAEPMFQDGFVSRSVDSVVGQGVAYYSSAGNNADMSYEAPYDPTRNFAPGAFDSEDFAPLFRGGTLHADFFKVIVPEDGFLNLPMQWDQPYFSQTLPLNGLQPGSLSDYDIYVFSDDFDPFEDEPVGTVVGGSVFNNIGGDPYEQLFFVNDADIDGEEFFVAVFKRFDPVTLNVSSTNVPVVIPNDGNTVSSNLVVLNPGGIAQNAVITDLNVRLHIDHEYDEDLSVSLLSPSGTVIELFAGIGGAGNNFGSAGFRMGLDDEAALALADGNPPYLNFFVPANALDEFDGESPYGTWQLLITDDDNHSTETPLPANTGTLQNWSLEIRTDADPTPNADPLKIVDFGSVSVPPLDGFPGIVGSSTLYGHANAIGAQATGAVLYTNAPGVSGNPLLPEPFSSLGGTQIFFGDFGNRLSTPELRLKPEISAPDGTNTTFFPGPRVGVPLLDSDIEGDGFPNFFGTSAAAPHAAAIAALMRQAVPDATPQEVYAAMQKSAVDMLSVGHDFLSGYGFVLADEAIKAISSTRRGAIEGTKFIDRDGDGVRDADEEGLAGFTVFLDVNQNGVRDEITESHTAVTLPQEIIDAFPILNLTTTVNVSTLVFGIPTSNLIDVNVRLNIEHDAVQDLDVFLISPTGRRIQLFSDIGGNGDDLLGTILDSEATTSIAAGAPPYTGRFRPLESFVPLYSEDPNGFWLLEITDDTALNKGVVKDFTLEFKYLEPTATTDAQGKYRFSNLTIGGYTVAEIQQPDWKQTTFVGAAAKPLLVTEIDPGGTDGFEIQNVSDSVLDTSGWFVAISDAPFGTINEVNSVVWQLPDEIGPREVLYRTDSPSNNYFGANIFWNKNNTRIGSGWVMIVDDAGKVVDWAGWGWTPEDIAGFDVTINGVHVTSLTGSWSGAGADRSGVGTLQRTGNQDTNTTGDFRWFNTPSMSEQNFLAGLVVPVQSALNSQNVTLIGGELTVTEQDFGNQFIGAFPRVIATTPVDRVAPPISSVEFAFTEFMNIGSFSIADIVSFTGPGGNLLPAITSITPLNGGTRFRVNFAAQSTEGSYSMVIGPNVTAADDSAAMDQDLDDIAGEVVEDRFTLNFVVGSAEIHGLKWNDINGNATRDAGEPGLAGWTIYIDANTNGILDGGDISTTTDATGAYQFLVLPAGTYTVREVVEPGFAQSFPAGNGAQIVVLAAGAIVTGVDFGNRPTPGWLASGPSPITEGQVEGINNRPVAGAIHTVLAHPTNANILYAGAVNGGVWRTTNATNPGGPTWAPLIDEFPSLSVGAMEMDPANPLRLVVGVGRFSSLSRDGGELTGLLLTNDGGDTWTEAGTASLTGRNISGVALRGATILVSANNAVSGAAGLGGLYRSIDGGSSFQLISGTNGLPIGDVTDLVGDPTSANRFYVAVAGGTGGIFRSDDGGASWVNVTPLDSQIGGTTNNIEMAVNRSAGVVYVGVVNNGRLVRFFRSATQGGSWTPMDIPQTIEGGTPIGIQPNPKPGAQGAIHFSVAADPTNVNLVYVGGDRQPDPFPNSIGALNFTGRLFRGNAAAPPGSQWTPLTHNGTTTNSAPHADSREMVFDAAGNMIETDDGGIYRRTSPATNTGAWQSLNGNLQITEFHSVAYDRVSNIVIGGTQDVGTVEQSNAGSLTWSSVNQGDGGVVAVDDSIDSQSIRYSSSQFLGNFQRRTVNTSNIVVDVDLGTGRSTPVLHTFRVE